MNSKLMMASMMALAASMNGGRLPSYGKAPRHSDHGPTKKKVTRAQIKARRKKGRK